MTIRQGDLFNEAQALVQTICDQGYDMVIATNPLFPARAIEHRLN